MWVLIVQNINQKSIDIIVTYIVELPIVIVINMFISQVDPPAPATAVDRSTLNLSPTRGNEYDATTSHQ